MIAKSIVNEIENDIKDEQFKFAKEIIRVEYEQFEKEKGYFEKAKKRWEMIEGMEVEEIIKKYGDTYSKDIRRNR